MDDAAKYGEEILLLIEQAIDGELNREDFETLLRRKVYASLEATFRRGANIPPGDRMFPAEQITLNEALTSHETSIRKMTDELYGAIELERAARRGQ